MFCRHLSPAAALFCSRLTSLHCHFNLLVCRYLPPPDAPPGLFWCPVSALWLLLIPLISQPALSSMAPFSLSLLDALTRYLSVSATFSPLLSLTFSPFTSALYPSDAFLLVLLYLISSVFQFKTCCVRQSRDTVPCQK